MSYLLCKQYLLAALMIGMAGLSSRTKAQDDLGKKTDEAVDAERAAQKIPGISVAICRDGKIEKAAGYGLANVEWNNAVAPDTIFQTGSVGKQFTSAAIMMLVEEGKIGLDDKLATYVQGTPAAWKEVTIRHLLTHTSGIADYGGEEGTMGKGVINFRNDYTEEQLVEAFGKMPMDFAPGEKWRYSNTGYVLKQESFTVMCCRNGYSSRSE